MPNNPTLISKITVFFHPQSQHVLDIKTSVLYVNGQASLVTLDYLMDTGGAQARDDTDSDIAKKGRIEGQIRRYCCKGFSNGSL